MADLGQCWHAVSVNRASEPRIGLLGQWLPFYFASMEAHMMTTPSAVKEALSPKASELLGLDHVHPMRSPKLWAARHDSRAARRFASSALRAALGLEGAPGVAPSAVRSPAVLGALLAAVSYFAGARRGGGPVGGAVALLAAAGVGGAGFLLGAVATLDRLQIGRL